MAKIDVYHDYHARDRDYGYAKVTIELHPVHDHKWTKLMWLWRHGVTTRSSVTITVEPYDPEFEALVEALVPIVQAREQRDREEKEAEEQKVRDEQMAKDRAEYERLKPIFEPGATTNERYGTPEV